ncbi:MAG TPA: imidazolonepropionase [Candidatus Thermoplasmatota archaeon]|nr:imidazolonepropionase [Candidatus Thermoplasmatota archaeon]
MPEAPVDLLIRTATVATLEGPNKPRDGFEASETGLEAGWTIAVRAGRIVWVGPDPDWKGKAAKTVDAKRKLVTPGYVDPHTHLVYGGERSGELKQKLQGKTYSQILAAGGGILQTVRATREATDNELEEAAAIRLKRMLHCGTTTVEAKSGYGLDTRTELRQLALHPKLSKRTGVPVVSTYLAHAIPEEHKADPDVYVDLVLEETLPAVAKQEVARFCDVFVDEGAFTVEQGERILKTAKDLGFQLRMHADELADTGAAGLGARLGCHAIDHLLKVSDPGIAAMAEHGSIAALAPTVPLTLLTRQWAPASRLMEALVPIAIATDHNPNNPVVDQQFAAQMACYGMGLTPAQALTGVTWNAACALGVEDKVGSIEEGKIANLVLHDVANVNQWIAEFGRNTAAMVVLNGRIVPA